MQVIYRVVVQDQPWNGALQQDIKLISQYPSFYLILINYKQAFARQEHCLLIAKEHHPSFF